MSSLHQDHLLAEGSEPDTGSARTLVTARGTTRRPVAEKVTSTVPSQRQGTAQRSGSTQTTTTEGGTTRSRIRRSSAGKASGGAAGSIAARAKAAGTATRRVATGKTVKAATAKAASATAVTKAATAKAATAARSAAAAKVAARGAGRPATVATSAPVAKPAPAAEPVTTAQAAPAATPATVAKAAPAAKPTAAAKAVPAARPESVTGAMAAESSSAAAVPATVAEAPRVRPTPHKRTLPTAPVLAAVAEQAEAVVDASSAPAAAPEAAEESLRTRISRLRPPSIARRPGVYLAAALIGALTISSVTTEPTARATDTMSHSVSVAEELGIAATPTEAITDTDAAEKLGELAVSRNARDAEQAAAVAAQAEADRLAAEAAAAAAAEAARPKVVLPVSGARLTSGFGARWGTQHAGIDLAAPMQTPEYAAMDGVVLEAGPASGYGLAVYIQHDNGDVTVYGHMDSILVQAGQVVRAGDTIALLGNRGQSTGPHLHFEVHVGGLNGEKIDPLPWLRERGIQI